MLTRDDILFIERHGKDVIHEKGVIVHNSDFQSNAKDGIKGFFAREYGNENICSVGTIGYLKVKSTLKELGRTFGIDDKVINEITTKGMDGYEKEDDSLTCDELCQKFPAIGVFLDAHPEMKSVFSKIQGTINNWGIHAGGILISDKPLTTQLPLRVDKKSGKLVSCWSEGLNGRELGEMGFLKLDLLAITTLDVIEDAINLINERHGDENGRKVTFDGIMDIMVKDQEPRVLDRIEHNENQGVFQFETPLALRVVKDMKGLQSFEDIAMLSTLMRPAALQNNYGSIFGKRKTGEEQNNTPDCVKKYMEREFGVPAFQESAYFFGMHMAGLSKVLSYKWMKALYKGKIHTKDDEKYWHDKFVYGCIPKIKHEEYDIEFENGEKRHYTEYDKLKCTDGIERTVKEIVEKGLEVEEIK